MRPLLNLVLKIGAVDVGGIAGVIEMKVRENHRFEYLPDS